jgi:raffinose/stachyose/melibiose transport system permease protein
VTPKRIDATLNYAVLLVFTLIAVIPILGILLNAFGRPDDLTTGFGVPDHPTFESFRQAWRIGHFQTYLRSSVIVSAAVVTASCGLSILSGYAFGLMRFRGATLLFYLMLIGIIVPTEALIVPLYYDLRDHGLTDTYWALILPQIALSVPFGTFWMRAFFRSTPMALTEASRLDGASSFATLTRVLLPQAWPAITTMLVLVFMWTWNEFLLALVMIQSDTLRTAPLGLAIFSGANRSFQPTVVAAAAVLVALPIVIAFLFAQRSFIRGMFAGSVNE